MWTHIFSQRRLFEHSFVLGANLYGHRPRSPLFESASRRWHNPPRLHPEQRSTLVRAGQHVHGQFVPSSCWPPLCVNVWCNCSGIRSLSATGSPAPLINSWLPLTDRPDKWEETAISLRVICVVASWYHPYLLFPAPPTLAEKATSAARPPAAFAA